MTGPISTAMGSNRAYKGAFGSTGGDIGRMIQQLTDQAKADQVRKEDLALKQGLLGVQQSEAENRGKTLQHSIDEDALRYQAGRTDAAEHTREFGITDQRTRDATAAQLAATEEQRKWSREEAARDNAANLQSHKDNIEQTRLNRQLRSESSTIVPVLNDKGETELYEYDRYGQRGRRMVMGPNGSIVPQGTTVQPGAEGSGTQQPAPPDNTPTDHPHEQGVTSGPHPHALNPAPSHQMNATMHGEQPLQPRAQPLPPLTPSAQFSQSMTPPVPKEPQGVLSPKSLAPQPERKVLADAENLTSVWGQYKQNLEALHGQAPSFPEWELMQRYWKAHTTGTLEEQGISNELLGQISPQWQAFTKTAHTLSAMLALNMAGKRSAQQVYEMFDAMHIPMSGDREASIQQKVGNVEEFIKSSQAAVSPRAYGGKNADSLWASLTQPKNYDSMVGAAHAENPAQAYYNALRDQGISDSEAARQADAKFPQGH